MEKENNNARPLWYVMLVLLSVMPLVLWLYVFEQRGAQAQGMMRFVLTWFPLEIVGLLGASYYLCGSRREVSNVLLAVAWLSYAALASLIWLP
ncbi:MAG: hypothetical protein ACI308_00690 [Muribaculaceae bacterium]